MAASGATPPRAEGPAGEGLCAAPARVGGVALDLGDRRRVDQRADLDALVEPRPDRELRDCVGEATDEVVVYRVLDEDPVRRDAGLARVPELAKDRAGH